MNGTSRRETNGGAYTDIAALIRLRHAAKELPNLKVNKSHNPLAGLLTSNFKGRGIDFAEVRQYEPGDDVRTIDWRVTARTQQPHTKLFQEERERPVMFLVDQSSSMFFGSRVRFKSVLAAEIASLLAWSSLHHGDRVGGMVFNNEMHREVRPRRNKHAVLRLLHELNNFNLALNRDNPQANGNNFSSALLNIRRIAKHGYTVVIVSDFQQMDEDALLHLTQLCRHNEVMGIHVSDPMEIQMPVPDLYTITNGSDRVEINTSNERNRSAYAQHFQHHLDVIKHQFARLKSPMISLRTDLDVLDQLLSVLESTTSRGR